MRIALVFLFLCSFTRNIYALNEKGFNKLYHQTAIFKRKCFYLKVSSMADKKVYPYALKLFDKSKEMFKLIHNRDDSIKIEKIFYDIDDIIFELNNVFDVKIVDKDIRKKYQDVIAEFIMLRDMLITYHILTPEKEYMHRYNLRTKYKYEVPAENKKF